MQAQGSQSTQKMKLDDLHVIHKHNFLIPVKLSIPMKEI